MMYIAWSPKKQKKFDALWQLYALWSLETIDSMVMLFMHCVIMPHIHLIEIPTVAKSGLPT